MAIKVPPIGQVTSLWQTRSAGATQQYRDGVSNAGGSWQTAVDNAEDNWSQGVSAAAGAHAYRNGTQGKGGHYVDRAVNVGAGRFGPGVQAATQAYTSGMGKVLGVIAGVNLPPRNVTGSNQGRSSAVDDALHQAKLAGQI
jgi:hypothetical protein